MSNEARQVDELRPLLIALVDDQLDGRQQQRLAELLHDDPAARTRYLQFMLTDAMLRVEHVELNDRGPGTELTNRGPGTSVPGCASHGRGPGTSVPGWAAPAQRGVGGGDDSWFRIQDSEIATPRSVTPDSLPRVLIDDPLSTAWGSYGNALLSYAIATVVFALGLTVAAFWKLPDYAQVARHTAPAIEKRPADPEPNVQFVGRITGMVDCRWGENPKSEIRNPKEIINYKSEIINRNSLVALGDTFTLASGLLEITYDTGAKVILQGPVTYDVESRDGGYLALGKLTAKLEKRSAVSGQQSEIINLKSEIHPSPLSPLPSPLFTIKTPTAVVTDLGTEFGVEVLTSGGTSAHVFRGVVEVQPADDHGQEHRQAVRLTANESVRVEKPQGGKEIVVHRAAANAGAFVRVDELPKLVEERRLGPFRRWQAYSEQLRKDPSLLAYYDFQQKPGSPSVLANVAANGHGSYDGAIENARWTTGRMPGKQALLFNGLEDFVRVNLPQKVDDLTLAAWIYVESLPDLSSLLASDGWLKTGLVHWQLVTNGHVSFDVCGCGSLQRSQPFWSDDQFSGDDRLRRWTHLAVSYDHHALRVRFYADGRPAGQAADAATVPACIGSARIGQWNFGDYAGGGRITRTFRGRIDELAIFARILTPDEIRRMFEAGKVPSQRTEVK